MENVAFNLAVTGLTKTPEGVVTHVAWAYTGIADDGITVTKTGGSNLVAPPSAPAFTDFSSLTESQVQGWVAERMKDQDFIGLIQSVIRGEIEQQRQAAAASESTGSEAALPWEEEATG